MRRDPEVERIVSEYQLGLPRMPVAGGAGELLGRGVGSSVEFQEFREYLPGDDIRHLDWSAYARTDHLMVRLYREEITPRIEILLDASRSMTTGEGAKEQLARRLAAVFAQLAARMGGRPAVLPLHDERPLRAIDSAGLDALELLRFDAVATLSELLADAAIPLKPQSVRIVISDFLFPHDPERVLKRLAAGAGALWIIQLLTAWEADPTELGARRLVDIERGGRADLLINRRSIAAYLSRLQRLQQGLTRAARRVHARFAVLVADRGLAPLCREELCAAEMLRLG